MFHKNSILDRKVRPSAYQVNIENIDRVYNKEQEYWQHRREYVNNTQVR